MKNIFKSHVTCGLTLSLLCLGGSVQAVNMTSLFRPSAPASVVTMIQKKSFFASHPVLTYSGIGVLSAVVLYTTSAVYRAHRNTNDLNVNKSTLVVMKNDWDNIGAAFSAAGKRIASWFKKPVANIDADKTISTGAPSNSNASTSASLNGSASSMTSDAVDSSTVGSTSSSPVPVTPVVANASAAAANSATASNA